MSKSLDQLLSLVNHSEIASIKATLSKIIEVIHNPESSVMDLKNLIEIDPPLAANVLRRANSAFYGMRRGIHSIMDAIIFIGFDAVKELTLNQKFFELFQKNGVEIHGYSRRVLWEHSIGVALCGKLIYRREFRKNGGDMYTAGLIHDIGIIVEDQFLHAELLSILADKEEHERDLHSAEADVLGYCHEDIGKRLAEDWNFPEELSWCSERRSVRRRVKDPVSFSRIRFMSPIVPVNCVKWDFRSSAGWIDRLMRTA
jgi:HD-like signal output (HDOD) protein